MGTEHRLTDRVCARVAATAEGAFDLRHRPPLPVPGAPPPSTSHGALSTSPTSTGARPAPTRCCPNSRRNPGAAQRPQPTYTGERAHDPARDP